MPSMNNRLHHARLHRTEGPARQESYGLGSKGRNGPSRPPKQQLGGFGPFGYVGRSKMSPLEGVAPSAPGEGCDRAQPSTVMRPFCRAPLAFIAGIALTLVLLGVHFPASAQPTISRQPADATASLGATVNFTVTATPQARVQWRFNGTAMEGATTSRLSITDVSLAHRGTYSALISNDSGSITSRLAQLDVDPTFTKIMTGEIVTDKANTQAPAWADVDRDGWVDLLLFNFNGRNALYRNNGDGTFTKDLGDPITQTATPVIGAAVTDLDNDGYADACVANINQSGNLLFLNNGSGNFVRITNSVRGTLTGDRGNFSSCSAADIDGDGFLDVYFSNRDGAGFLYRNSGDGQFQRVTDRMPISTLGAGYGCPWGDYNDDGLPDLFVGRDDRNLVYRNLGGGSFLLDTNSILYRDPKGVSGAGFADCNNDGHLDFFAGNGLGGGSGFYLNNGDGSFTKVTNSVVTMDKGKISGGPSFADYDNDGDLDLFVGRGSNSPVNSALFANNGDGTFVEIKTGSLVADLGRTGGSGWADFDRDGFMDLVAANIEGVGGFLYRNNGNSNHWLVVRLEGTSSPRSAIGSRVYLEADGIPGVQLRELSTGDGFSGGTESAHFGLGQARQARSVRIRWSSGIEQTFTNLTADQILTFREPARIRAKGAGELAIPSWRGQAFSVWASDDLVSWKNLGAHTNTGVASVSFKDPESQHSRRFYRVAHLADAGQGSEKGMPELQREGAKRNGANADD